MSEYVNPHIVSLHNGGVAVTVYYKPRNIVTLTMKQPERGVIVFVDYSKGFSHGVCGRQASVPEFIINLDV